MQKSALVCGKMLSYVCDDSSTDGVGTDMRKSPKSIHVVKHPDGWAVKTAGSPKAEKVTQTQKQAIDAGKAMAKNKGAELNIHGRDGKIRSKDSYGNDPNPPKDKEH